MSANPWSRWQEWWRAAVPACSAKSQRCKANSLAPTVAPPASTNELAAVEEKLGHALPLVFRNVLLLFSKSVRFAWYCDPYDCQILGPPQPVSSVLAGGCRWDLSALAELDGDRERYARTVFPNVSDPFEAVWHGKLAFQRDGYGNYLALDLDPGSFQERRRGVSLSRA